MPVPNSLFQLAVEHGLTREQIVLNALAEADGKANSAAELLGVAPNTVHNYLRNNGYRYVEKQWVKLGQLENGHGGVNVGSRNTAMQPDKRKASPDESKRSRVQAQS